MDIFEVNHLKGKIFDNLCADINKLFGLRHPCKVDGKKILNQYQLDSYEEMVPIQNRDIELYMISMIFVKNNKCGEEKYPWTLMYRPTTKKELRKLFNDLNDIKLRVKCIKNVSEIDLINMYNMYEKYLPN